MKQPNYARTLSRELGLTVTQTIELLDNPEAFIAEKLGQMRAAHLSQLDAILRALERKAKTGDVKAAECWLRFIGSSQTRDSYRPSTGKPSRTVVDAVQWLPKAIDVEPIDATPLESVKLLGNRPNDPAPGTD